MAVPSDALAAPTVEFIGGPWDGRKSFFNILHVEFRVPFFDDGAEVDMDPMLVFYNHPRVGEFPYHVYKRASMVVKTGTTPYAKYMYKGLVR